MTKKQEKDYMKMYHALKVIHAEYQTAQQLIKNSEKDYGVDPQEALEMAYDNIKETARAGIKGVRSLSNNI